MACSPEFLSTKREFIERWGQISSSWGVCKSMAQIHALLLVSPKPLSATCIIDELNISSGGANTHLRDLVEWGLIYKCEIKGCRKDYYIAEKDILKASKIILENRKKRELDPIVELMNQVDHQQANCPDSMEFVRIIQEIKTLSTTIENTLDSILNTDKHRMLNTLFRLVQ